MERAQIGKVVQLDLMSSAAGPYIYLCSRNLLTDACHDVEGGNLTWYATPHAQTDGSAEPLDSLVEQVYDGRKVKDGEDVKQGVGAEARRKNR